MEQQFNPYPLCPARCGGRTTDIAGGPCVACQPPPPDPEPQPHACSDPDCTMAGQLVDEHGHPVAPP